MTELPKRILVALAFSDHSDEIRTTHSAVDHQVLAQAEWLARASGGDLLLVHAIEEKDVSFVDADGTLHNLIEEYVSKEIARVASEVRERGIEVETAIVRGHARDVTLAQAASWGADLIVVGPHRQGYAFVERLLHGSTARSLLRSAPTSVWVTHVDQTVHPSRVLVAVGTDSSVAPQLVAHAKALARACTTDVALLHCLEYPDLMALRRMTGTVDAIAEYKKSVREQARGKLSSLLDDEVSHWPVLLTEDSLAHALQRAKQNKEADLVILSRTSEPGLAGQVLGSTAEQVLHHVEMNTWVVKTG